MTNLVAPIELCLESLDPSDDAHPYVRCVALAGGEPGLGLTADGSIVWRQNDTASLLLWVSADNRLMALRSSEAHRVRLTRAERFLELPANKPVVTLHEDVIEIEGRSFRVHVHGLAQRIEPPTRLLLRRAQRWLAGTLAAASLAACHTSSPGNVPTSAGAADNQGFAQPPPGDGAGGTASNTAQPVAQGGTRGPGTTPPIEIREAPPAPMPMPPN